MLQNRTVSTIDEKDECIASEVSSTPKNASKQRCAGKIIANGTILLVESGFVQLPRGEPKTQETVYMMPVLGSTLEHTGDLWRVAKVLDSNSREEFDYRDRIVRAKNEIEQAGCYFIDLDSSTKSSKLGENSTEHMQNLRSVVAAQERKRKRMEMILVPLGLMIQSEYK